MNGLVWTFVSIEAALLIISVACLAMANHYGRMADIHTKTARWWDENRRLIESGHFEEYVRRLVDPPDYVSKARLNSSRRRADAK